MQFQVPQFIEVEDKLIGPLTLKQFLYIAAAGGLSFVLFFYVQMWLWFILSIFLTAAAASLAFLKINGRPLIHVILSAISFYWQPQTYVWQPEHPKLPKTQSTLEKFSKGMSLEKIVSGLSLRNVWQNVQTGSKTFVEEGQRGFQRAKERYEIIHKLSGERRAIKRVDYR